MDAALPTAAGATPCCIQLFCSSCAAVGRPVTHSQTTRQPSHMHVSSILSLSAVSNGTTLTACTTPAQASRTIQDLWSCVMPIPTSPCAALEVAEVSKSKQPMSRPAAHLLPCRSGVISRALALLDSRGPSLRLPSHNHLHINSSTPNPCINTWPSNPPCILTCWNLYVLRPRSLHHKLPGVRFANTRCV